MHCQNGVIAATQVGSLPPSIPSLSTGHRRLSSTPLGPGVWVDGHRPTPRLHHLDCPDNWHSACGYLCHSWPYTGEQTRKRQEAANQHRVRWICWMTHLSPGAKPPLGLMVLMRGDFDLWRNWVSAGTLSQLTVLWTEGHTYVDTHSCRNWPMGWTVPTYVCRQGMRFIYTQ